MSTQIEFHDRDIEDAFAEPKTIEGETQQVAFLEIRRGATLVCLTRHELQQLIDLCDDA